MPRQYDASTYHIKNDHKGNDKHSCPGQARKAANDDQPYRHGHHDAAVQVIHIPAHEEHLGDRICLNGRPHPPRSHEDKHGKQDGQQLA